MLAGGQVKTIVGVASGGRRGISYEDKVAESERGLGC